MPITASSTRTQVLQAYLDYSSYATGSSLAAAREFELACRMLLSMPEESGDRDGNVKMRLMQYERDLSEVRSWIIRNSPAVNMPSSVVLADFRRGRD